MAKQETEARDYTGSEYLNESWAFLISFFRWYPDVLADIFRSPDATYKNEELIQRVMMRAFARYQYVDITGCRSLTKTSTTIKGKLIDNILWPSTRTSYYGPSYRQQSELARDAFADITANYPVLAAHYKVVDSAKDAWSVQTTYGSSISINAMRGKNIHNVVAEEYAQEEKPPFDYAEYSTVVLYAVRLLHMVNGRRDPTYIPYKEHTITSAGRRQNHSYDTRTNHMQALRRGQSAFVMDVPWQVIVLSQMRPLEWAIQRRENSTPERWLREMESRYTGTDENPMVRDETLTQCRDLMVMEEHHCCRDRENRFAPHDVIYIVGYYVSYEDDKKNAKCALVVLKLTRQKDRFKRDRYLKECVYVDDYAPPATNILQARRLKQVWMRYCAEEGHFAYIAMDAWQYGRAVLEALMMDLEDGLPPLCVVDHASYTELEIEGALPVIYPIKAGGLGVTDPDAEMIRYAEIQFEHHNVRLLTSNANAGLEAYKHRHRIRDDTLDPQIFRPYQKTQELVGQIQNLKKVPSGSGVSERRISKHIQRDSWSALKYALRLAQKLEYKNLIQTKRKRDWQEFFKKNAHTVGNASHVMPRAGLHRRGGKLF